MNMLGYMGRWAAAVLGISDDEEGGVLAVAQLNLALCAWLELLSGSPLLVNLLHMAWRII